MEGLCDQCNTSLLGGRKLEIYKLSRNCYSLKEDGILVDLAPTAIPLEVEFCSAKCLRLFVERMD